VLIFWPVTMTCFLHWVQDWVQVTDWLQFSWTAENQNILMCYMNVVCLLLTDRQLPQSWDPMSPSDAFKQVALNPASTEYRDVEKNVISKAANTVHQIISVSSLLLLLTLQNYGRPKLLVIQWKLHKFHLIRYECDLRSFQLINKTRCHIPQYDVW